MSTRTDQARRLELSQVEELGEFVTGRARGMTVSLEGAPPFTACVVELGVALPLGQLLMRPGDLNHPDAVETGDVDFDEQMQVLALPRHAPTMEKVLAEPAVRSELLAFFKRYPGAELVGSRLRVPGGGEVTQRTITDALALAETINRRFTAVGFLETEAAAQLPPAATGGFSLAARVGAGLGFGSVFFLVVSWLLDLKADSFGLGVGALCLSVGLASTMFVPEPDKK